MCMVFSLFFMINYVLIQVIALKSQLDEQNKRYEEREKRYEEQEKRFEIMMNFFFQSYQGQLPPELTMFNRSSIMFKKFK